MTRGTACSGVMIIACWHVRSSTIYLDVETCLSQKHIDHHFFPRFMSNDTVLKREHWCGSVTMIGVSECVLANCGTHLLHNLDTSAVSFHLHPSAAASLNIDTCCAAAHYTMTQLPVGGDACSVCSAIHPRE